MPISKDCCPGYDATLEEAPALGDEPDCLCVSAFSVDGEGNLTSLAINGEIVTVPAGGEGGGSTSVLTDNEDGTYTHDDGDGNTTTFSSGGGTVTDNGDSTTTISDGTNDVTVCTDAPQKVRVSATPCVYEVVEGCGATLAVVETIDARKALQFELGQFGMHMVDGALADQHSFVAPPASVGTNIVLTGATYDVAGDIDFDVDIAGTVVSFTGVSGAGDLAALGGITFPVSLANLAEVREALTAVNTVGDGFTLHFYGCYCPA